MRAGPSVTSGAVEALLLAVFAALSLWMIALSVWQVVRAGVIWSGTDGLFPQDQMQYLAWIRDASRHGLSSNLFQLHPSPHDYLQPAVAVSAALTALGLPPWLALLLWKPVAVAAVLVAIRTLVHRTVEGDGARLAALALALFFTGWGALVSDWVGNESFRWAAITNELWVPFWSWGYPFGLLAVAATVGALLAYARDREAGRIGATAPLLTALASWVHPWQGETLALVLLGAEGVAWSRGRRPGLSRLSVTLIAAALPLAYYVVLGRADTAWRLAQQASHTRWPFWLVALSVAPLALPAALAYRSRAVSFLDTTVRVWPAAALAVFFIGQTPHASSAQHAILGVSVPLAILAVQGVRSLKLSALSARPIAVLALLALMIAPSAHELTMAQDRVHQSLKPNFTGSPSDARFLEPGVRNALHWLRRDQRDGGVLTRSYLGTAVPAETGRATWVGNSYWSGGRLAYFDADVATISLFRGPIEPRQARALVRTVGARFLLADCVTRPDLRDDLGALVREVHRFGCAQVLVVSP